MNYRITKLVTLGACLISFGCTEMPTTPLTNSPPPSSESKEVSEPRNIKVQVDLANLKYINLLRQWESGDRQQGKWGLFTDPNDGKKSPFIYVSEREFEVIQTSGARFKKVKNEWLK